MQVKEESSVDPIIVDGVILGLCLMPLVVGLRATLFTAAALAAGSKAAEASLPYLPPYSQARYKRTLAMTRQVLGG